MYRASTPYHEFELPFKYEYYVDKLLITYSQNGNIVLEKTETDVSFNENIVSFTLTQEETKLFKKGLVEVQVRVYTTGKQSIVSDMIYFFAEDVLNDKELVWVLR